MAEVQACDWGDCGKVIKPNPKLGDKQGQKVEVRFAAYTQEGWLCEDHIKLLDKWRSFGTRREHGTLGPGESLPYLPRLD